MPRLSAVLLIVLLGATACRDSSADRAASQVQQGLQAMQEAQGPDPSEGPVRDSIMDDACANMTQRAMDEAEAKVADLTGELVVLHGEEQTALACSRYRKYLSGEIDHWR